MAGDDTLGRSLRSDTQISAEREAELLARLRAALSRFSAPRGRSAAPLYNDVLSCTNPVITREGPTLHVSVRQPYGVILGLNPDFILGPEDAPAPTDGRVAGLDEASLQFVLAHEAEHVLLHHLRIPVTDPLHRDAREIAINFRVMRTLGLDDRPTGMPTRTDPATGVTATVGSDPQEWFQRVRDRCRTLGVPGPGTLEQFAGFELDTLTWMRRARMWAQDEDAFARGCSHDEAGDNDGDGDDGSDGEGSGEGKAASPGARDELAEIAAAVVREAALTATPGTPLARQLGILSRWSGPDGSKSWGTLGVGAARSAVLEERRNRMPVEDLAAEMATRLREGERLRRIHKSLSDNEWRWRGVELHPVVAVFVDTSGSMHERTLQLVSRALGLIPDVTTVFHAFDTEVYLQRPGDPLRGGGGTSFQTIDEHVRLRGAHGGETGCECCEDGEPPDLVVVVTDGYAPAVQPEEPDRWIWVVTPDGAPARVVELADMAVLALTEGDLEQLGAP